MAIRDYEGEITHWLATQFPQDDLAVRGQTLTIVQRDPDGTNDPLVRVQERGSQQFQLSYMRHTGQWEEIPPLTGPWPMILKALAEDPLGLFSIGLRSRLDARPWNPSP
jgi:hypothetical protein